MSERRWLAVAATAALLAACGGLCAAAAAARPHRILVVFPMPSRSHSILGGGVVNSLLAAGHRVTYVTPFPLNSTDPNLQQIDLSIVDAFKNQSANVLNLEDLLSGKAPEISEDMMLGLTMMANREAFLSAPVQALLGDPRETFDLAIIEWMFTEVAAGFSAVLGCPLVWVCSTEPHYMVTHLVDEYLHPAYSVGMLSDTVAPLTFWQRVNELRTQIISYLKKEYVFYSVESKAYEEVFGPAAAKRGQRLPALREIKYNASLVLGNSHVSLGDSGRLPQSYKPVGGYHISSQVKPLPQNLQKIMDDAEHGVIYFSMGSNLRSKDLPDDIKRGLLKMFGGLEQTVVWKFEEELSDLPKNVHILQWAPQHSILAHPNCVLFITHGGLLSTTETIHFGKPIIGIPVFGDQYANVKRAVARGYAEHVKLSYSLVEDLAAAVRKVLSNPRYAERARRLSVVYHDRPVRPAAELAHWAQHVVRTQGAPHLRAPALHVPLYQKMYLDLAALVLALAAAARFAIKLLINALRVSKSTAGERKKNE